MAVVCTDLVGDTEVPRPSYGGFFSHLPNMGVTLVLHEMKQPFPSATARTSPETPLRDRLNILAVEVEKGVERFFAGWP